MDKKLQDLAWAVLPKEFKEEVRRIYKILREKKDSAAYYYDGLFGYHNLTSDAEGEEMLTVSRKQVQETYADIINDIRDYNGENPEMVGTTDPILRERAAGMKAQLHRLFGSKCLPDDTKEPKPAEPKFKDGDIVRYRYDRKLYIVECKTGKYNYTLRQYDCDILMRDVLESDLEPYTEPDASHEAPVCENHSDNTSQKEANVNSNHNLSKDCDKQLDNILKDSFSKERRLSIATPIMAAMLSNQMMLNNLAHGETTAEGVVKCIVDATMMYTDALISECEKGGLQ